MCAFYSRGKNKLQNLYKATEMYEFYIQNKEKDSPYYISKTEYISIVNLYFKRICELLLEGDMFYVPFGMGLIQILKIKIDINKTTLTPDWGLYNKTGVKTFHLNEHTRGYKYNIIWSKKDIKFVNNAMYRFQPVRSLKRTLARLIKVDKKDYIERY